MHNLWVTLHKQRYNWSQFVGSITREDENGAGKKESKKSSLELIEYIKARIAIKES